MLVARLCTYFLLLFFFNTIQKMRTNESMFVWWKWDRYTAIAIVWESLMCAVCRYVSGEKCILSVLAMSYVYKIHLESWIALTIVLQLYLHWFMLSVVRFFFIKSSIGASIASKYPKWNIISKLNSQIFYSSLQTDISTAKFHNHVVNSI